MTENDEKIDTSEELKEALESVRDLIYVSGDPEPLTGTNPDSDYREFIFARTPFPEDADDGILHFSREGKPAELELSRFERDELPDLQLPLPGDYVTPAQSEEHEVIRASAQKACANCPGHCCLAFTIGWTPESMEEKKVQCIKDLEAVAIEYLSQGPSPQLDKRTKEITILLYDLRFGTKNFELIGKDGYGGTYKCAQFDTVNRRCMSYDSRPTPCRKFICGAATSGMPPTGRSMETKRHPVIMEIIRKQHIYDPSSDYGIDRENPSTTSGPKT